jgi:tyrosine-protein kinase Etk/Wzc
MNTQIGVLAEAVRGQPKGQLDQHYFPLIDLAVTLLSRKGFLTGMAALGAIVSTIIALALTPLYTAVAIIMPPPKPQSISAALLGQMGAIAGALSPSLGLKDPADVYIGILKSRTIADDLINQFHLGNVYSVRTMNDARIVLMKRAKFVSGKDSLIQISVEDADRKLSADLANAFVSELYKQNNCLAVTESAQRRLFFENEVRDEEKALAAAEGHLQSVQQRTGVVQASGQADATIRSIVALRAALGMREVALQRLKMAATPKNPEVAGAEQEIRSIRDQLSGLESSSAQVESGSPLIPFGKAPQVGLELLRSLRDLKYHESVFEALSKQYEVARIDEAKEAQAIQVVDAAVPPEQKSWPPRLAIAVIGTISFVIIGCLIVFGQKEFEVRWRVLRDRLATAPRS